MKRVLYTFAIASCLVGCGSRVPDSRAREALETAGFSAITITENHWAAPEWHGCGASDDVAFDATANNPAGKRVTVTVCCGWGVVAEKGCTIRH